MHKNSKRYLICYVQSIVGRLSSPSIGKSSPYHKQNVRLIFQRHNCKPVCFRMFFLARHLCLTFIRKTFKPILWSCQVCYVPSICAFSFALETSYVCSWIVGTNISLHCLLRHQLCHYCDNYCFENYVVMRLHNLFDGGLSDNDNILY